MERGANAALTPVSNENALKLVIFPQFWHSCVPIHSTHAAVVEAVIIRCIEKYRTWTVCNIVCDWQLSSSVLVESSECIEFALFVNKIYIRECECVCCTFFVRSFVHLFPCFRSVWYSNTYYYDLNRAFCIAAKCYLIVFMHELFLLLYYCCCWWRWRWWCWTPMRTHNGDAIPFDRASGREDVWIRLNRNTRVRQRMKQTNRTNTCTLHMKQTHTHRRAKKNWLNKAYKFLSNTT